MSRRLGRGLDALIPSLAVDEKDHITQMDVNKIRPNPYQPRKTFNEEQLTELMASIKEHGVIQPIIVRESLNGYEIVAGERRWRATKALSLPEIPVVIRKFTDEQVMEVALIENIQREDLNPVEIAVAYEKIMKKLNITQEELAFKLGKSRPNVANFLRILHLPQAILEQVSSGNLTMGHARALIVVEDKNLQMSLCNSIIKESWSVRVLEDKIKEIKNNVSRETIKKKAKQTENKLIKQVENQLMNKFKTSVKIKEGKNRGKIEIEYFDQKDLQRIIEMIGID